MCGLMPVRSSSRPRSKRLHSFAPLCKKYQILVATSRRSSYESNIKCGFIWFRSYSNMKLAKIDWGTLGPMLTPQQVADLLCVKDRIITNMRARRAEGPPFLYVSGTVVRYPRDAFFAWVRANLKGAFEGLEWDGPTCPFCGQAKPTS